MSKRTKEEEERIRLMILNNQILLDRRRSIKTAVDGDAPTGTTDGVPVNVSLPTFSGTLSLGQTLTATTGTWTNSPSSYSYRWYSNGVFIPGATNSTFVITSGQIGTTITVGIIASNATGSSAEAISLGQLIPVEETVPRLAVLYNSSDYSYMTGSASWSDTGTFNTGSRTIAVITIVPDTVAAITNANLGVYITPKGAPLSRKILIKEAATNDVLVFDWETILQTAIDAGGSLATPPTPELRIASVGGQALSYDPVTGYIVEWTAANTVRMMNTAGVVQENDAIATGGLASGSCYYRHDTGDFFISQDTPSSPKRFRKIAGVWTLQETFWFQTSEGITYDYPGNTITSHSAGRIRSQDPAGLQCLIMNPKPTTGMSNEVEGLTVDPKYRIAVGCADEFFHGGIINGNRIAIQDVFACFQKWLFIGPDDIRWTEWSGGTVSGNYNAQSISGSDWIEGPIIDFGANTGQQSLANWIGLEYCDIEFRGSNSAPSTSVTPNLYSRPYYTGGWGATSPDAYSASPSLFRYVQPRIKPKAYTPPTAWSPADVAPVIWTDMSRRLDAYGQERMDMHIDGGDSPAANNFRVQIAMNKANTANNWTQVTNTQRPQWSTVNKYVIANGNLHFILTDRTPLLALSECDVHVVMRRTATTNTCIFLSASVAASNNNKLILQWLGSAAGNNLSISHTDNGGVTSLYGFSETGTVFDLYTFRLGGSSNEILKRGVSQSLTVTSGSNSGQCFDDVAVADTVRMCRVQATSSVNGTQDCKFLLVTPRLSAGNMTSLITYLINAGIIT